MADLIGTSSLGGNTSNSNLAGTSFGVRLQCTTTGDVDTLNLRSGPTGPAGSNVHGALYADNAGALTGATRLSSDVVRTFTANTILTFTVAPTVPVTSGTFYWLVFLGVGAVFDYTDFATTGGTTRDTSGQTTLATPAPTTTNSFTNRFNAYATGTATVTGAVQPKRRQPVPIFRASSF
jgi:hypothetical protein